jgi:hypothetical protein
VKSKVKSAKQASLGIQCDVLLPSRDVTISFFWIWLEPGGKTTAKSNTIGPFGHSFTHKAEIESDTAAHAGFFPQKILL